ncbi:Inter-alpha-trypsin inhibitor heavy chain H2, partial [Durusdinium trenchii]
AVLDAAGHDFTDTAPTHSMWPTWLRRRRSGRESKSGTKTTMTTGLGAACAAVLAGLPQALGARESCPCLTELPQALVKSEALDEERGCLFFQDASGTRHCYPTDYGLGGCKAHDEDLEPFCSSSPSPSFLCEKEWCFVDSDNCDLVTVESSIFPGVGLRYSNGTCIGQSVPWGLRVCFLAFAGIFLIPMCYVMFVECIRFYKPCSRKLQSCSRKLKLPTFAPYRQTKENPVAEAADDFSLAQV